MRCARLMHEFLSQPLPKLRRTTHKPPWTFTFCRSDGAPLQSRPMRLTKDGLNCDEATTTTCCFPPKARTRDETHCRRIRVGST